MIIHFFDLYKNNNNNIDKSKIKLFYEKDIKKCFIVKDKIPKILNYDIYILFTNTNILDKKILSNIKKIPRFPLLYDNYIILNSIQMKYLAIKNLKINYNNIFFQIYKKYNCIISNKPDLDLFSLTLNKKLIFFLNNRTYINKLNIKNIKHFNDLPFVVNCYNNNNNYIPENINGWYANSNVYQYIINNFDIKIMVELGAWYGRSTIDFAKLNPDMILYSFDSFQNVFTSTYTSDGNDPLDYFYNTFLRFETFHSNLKKYKNVFSVEYDCKKSLELLYKFNIKVDLFYIDFLKKTNDLVIFIKTILELFPKAIILGDDFVINSVKKAIEILKEEDLGVYIYTFKFSYIISPFLMEKKDMSKYFSKEKKKKEIILKNINNINNNTKYIIETAIYLLEEKSFEDFFTYIKKYDVDLNKRIESSFNDSLFIYVMKKYKNTKHLKIILDYKKPNNYKNSLCLTAYDYQQHNIYELD